MRRQAGARTFVISWWGQLYISKIYGPAPCVSLKQIPRTTLIGIPEGPNNGAVTWLTYFKPPNVTQAISPIFHSADTTRIFFFKSNNEIKTVHVPKFYEMPPKTSYNRMLGRR
jgi:hypothetical protein